MIRVAIRLMTFLKYNEIYFFDDRFFIEEIAKFHGFLQDSGIHKCNNQRLYAPHRLKSAVLVTWDILGSDSSISCADSLNNWLQL